MRPYLYVKDAADVLPFAASLSSNGGEAYNVVAENACRAGIVSAVRGEKRLWRLSSSLALQGDEVEKGVPSAGRKDAEKYVDRYARVRRSCGRLT